MKKLFLFLLIPKMLFAQWEMGSINTSSGKTLYAYGKIQTDNEYDDFRFVLMNNPILGIDFSIESKFFKEGEKYSISLEIDTSGELELKDYYVWDKMIQMNTFLDKNGNIKSVKEILKMLKDSLGCIIRIKHNGKSFEYFAYSKGYGSAEAIDFVIK